MLIAQVKGKEASSEAQRADQASSGLNNLNHANDGRDYSIYARAMDAAEDAKALDIFPHIDVAEGATILDLGAGTAALSERAARFFSRAQVIAQDISHELLEIADHRRALIKLLFGNALDQVLPDNSIDAAICSSCGHEIESFCGPGSMLSVLSVILKELKPGGRFVVRDFIKPDLQGEILMEIVGEDLFAAQASVASISGAPDYPKRSAAELFFLFHREFRGGGAFDYSIEQRGDRSFIRLPAEWAYEFYMRKDYVANWHNEISEKYSYWTAKEAELSFRAAGFADVKVIPHRNAWLVDNRLTGKIALFRGTGSSELEALPFFDTHMVVIGAKPGSTNTQSSSAELHVVDYDRMLASISIDRGARTLRIGERTFPLSEESGVIGSKREVFYLKPDDGVRRVLKIPRTNGLNTHNCFKAMQQTIERQGILEHYKVPHLKVLDFDRSGPPYRYLLQEALPPGARSAAELLRNGELSERDVAQMAAIVNRFELEKRWQLDTNPFNWFRVTKDSGETEMVYADGKVYKFDERWAFARVGLLQWIDPNYVSLARDNCAVIPSAASASKLHAWWGGSESGASDLHFNRELAELWRKHLAPVVEGGKEVGGTVVGGKVVDREGEQGRHV